MGNLDAKFSGNIFRKDNPQIIAQNRHLASLLPVRLAYDADGYPVGQVLARNSTSGLYQKYDDGGASGIDTARCLLFEEHPVEDFGSGVTGTTLAVGVFGGEVFKDKLVGLDANAETDLGSKTIIDQTGINVLKF